LSHLAHFATLIGARITLSGPPVQLHATAAQNIGMAIHELSTNAGKYGALSHDRGEIKITWDVSPNADNIDCLTLSWAETCGPTVSVPTRKGFGSIVLGGMIRSNLNADVKTEFHPQGLVWQMECLLSACSDEPAAS